MNLVFKDFGTVLGGRQEAAELRSKIESSSEVVTLDFADVRTVSHSFADELIGKLAQKYGPAHPARTSPSARSHHGGGD